MTQYKAGRLIWCIAATISTNLFVSMPEYQARRILLVVATAQQFLLHCRRCSQCNQRFLCSFSSFLPFLCSTYNGILQDFTFVVKQKLLKIPKNFYLGKQGYCTPPKQARGSGVYKCTLRKFARKLESSDS